MFPDFSELHHAPWDDSHLTFLLNRRPHTFFEMGSLYTMYECVLGFIYFCLLITSLKFFLLLVGWFGLFSSFFSHTSKNLSEPRSLVFLRAHSFTFGIKGKVSGKMLKLQIPFGARFSHKQLPLLLQCWWP